MDQIISIQDQILLPTVHPVDASLFFYKPDARSFLQFLQRSASESRISKFQSTSNGFLNKNLHLSNTVLPSNKLEGKAINNFNRDNMKPITAENVKSNELDNISTATTIDDLDDDIILNANSSLNTECHFRREKLQPSLTKTVSLNDETKTIIIDSIEKIGDNNNNEEGKSQKINENSQPISIEHLSLEEKNQEKQESNYKTTPSKQLPGRILSYRSYRQTSSISQEPISDDTFQSFVSTQTSISTPLSSPISPLTNTSPSCTSPNGLISSLKHTNSIRKPKKNVHFADSIGRELTQVKYIQSLTDDDSQELSYVKNNVYLQKQFNFEYKPWSFNIVLTSKQFYDTSIRRRFICLYRQPNSEHPDTYLHEIWKSQIKLEYANIYSKSSLTGEQYLYGTLWVTNDSYWKNVTIKYTFNRWLNIYEYAAKHCCHSNDFRNIDQFEFSINIPHDVDRIDFILRYYVNGQEYWDNNDGRNYTLETESASTPRTTFFLPHDSDRDEMRFY